MIRERIKFLGSLLVSVLVTFSIYGQNGHSELSIGGTQQITNFKFITSEGEEIDDYDPIYSGAYQIGYAHYLENGVFFKGLIGMRKAGATKVIDASNYQWDLHYGRIRLGGGYLYELGEVKPYLNVSGFFGYLLKANQTLNNQDYDILKNDEIQEADLGIYIGPGVKFTLNKSISFYTELGYLRGFQNIEPEGSEQTANNYAYSLTVGISYSIQN